MGRWLLSVLALGVAGCCNGLLLTPVHVGRPVEQVTICKPDHCLCRDKVAIIDVEGLLVNAKGGSLLYDNATAVELVQQTEKLLEVGLARAVPAVPAVGAAQSPAAAAGASKIGF